MVSSAFANANRRLNELSDLHSEIVFPWRNSTYPWLEARTQPTSRSLQAKHAAVSSAHEKLLKSFTKTTLRIPLVTPLATDLTQEKDFRARQTQLLKPHHRAALDAMNKDEKEQHFLERSIKIINEMEDLVHKGNPAVAGGVEFGLAAAHAGFGSMQTAYDTLLKGDMNRELAYDYAMHGIACRKLSSAIVSMPGFVSANFQRDVTTIAAESRATIDRTTKGYEDKRRAFETALQGDVPYQGNHEYLKGLRGLKTQFQARTDELKEENAAAAAALARLTTGDGADDDDVVGEDVNLPATPPRRRRRRDTQRGPTGDEELA